LPVVGQGLRNHTSSTQRGSLESPSIIKPKGKKIVVIESIVANKLSFGSNDKLL
jgi:hypothetical protein